MEKLLTVKDLCETLQVKKGLVYKWVHYGYVPHIKIGNLLRFKESQIDTWINKRAKKGRNVIKKEVELYC
jgi:excisionase family DNA binding protein